MPGYLAAVRSGGSSRVQGAAAWQQRAQGGPGGGKVRPAGYPQLLGDTDLPTSGPTTPEGVLLPELRREARQEWVAKNGKQNQTLDFLLDPALRETDRRETEIEALANSRLKKAMAEAGLS